MAARSRFSVPRAQSLARARLIAVLDRVLGARFGIVAAPPGSGKTTLMANWARRFPGTVVWYRCESADAERGTFIHRLTRAVGAVGAVADDQATAQRGTVESLIRRLEHLPARQLIVLDDFDKLAHSSAAGDVEALLLAAPPNLSVLLGTRGLPTFNFARTELPSPVMVLGDDLRFRAWEVDSLFRDFYGEPLRPDDAAALARRTEGWAAALQLFHLSIVGRSPTERSRAVSALAGRARYAQEYLSGQVLAGLPGELSEFLHRTCVFDVLTGPRCDALLDSESSQHELLDLERRQALTTSEDGGLTFRYHEVLRSHLEAALCEELGNTEARKLYCRAAEILEAEGASVEALRARCRAQDWAGVRRLLRDDRERLAADCRTEWVELLPVWLTESDPWMSLAEARRLLADGQLAAAETAARRAYDKFSDSVGREQCREVIRSVETWSRGPATGGAQWSAMLRLATRRAPSHAASDARAVTGETRLARGVALLLAGDQRAAGPELDHCGSFDEAPYALAARLILAGLRALLDPRPSALTELDGVYLEAERGGFTWLARLARGLAIARGGDPCDVDVAEAMAAGCDERGDRWGAALIRAGVALARLRRGEPDIDALDRLADTFRGLDAGVLEAWARSASALAAGVAQHPDALVQARAAEAFARAAAAPGATALAYAALGACQEQGGAELLRLARDTAIASGLDIRPWRWLGRSSRARETAAATAERAAPPVARAEPVRAAVEWRCFGSFRLLVGGEVVHLAGVRPRAGAMLRLLALYRGHPVHREQIADALWADLAPEAARHNVHVAISTLRRVLGDRASGRSLIERTGAAYYLALGEDVTCDLAEFDRALALADRARVAGADDAAVSALRSAIDLYTGDVLPEDGAAEWVVNEREGHRHRAAAAAALLAAIQLRRGEPREAADAAIRGIQIDRYHDDSWRSLIRARMDCGDFAAAQRARASYRNVLASLGLEPQREDLLLPHFRPRNSTSPIATSLPAVTR